MTPSLPSRPGAPPLLRTTVAGVPVAVGWSVLVVGSFVAWLLATSAVPAVAPDLGSGAAWLLAVGVVLAHVVSVTAHQVAEAVVARRHGLEVRQVAVALLGGRVQLAQPATTWRAELGTAAAGPVTSALVAGAVGVAAVVAAGLSAGPGGDALAAAVSWVAFGNLALAVIGLLPARPFPGGRESSPPCSGPAVGTTTSPSSVPSG
jgi:Zn-dependent protease